MLPQPHEDASVNVSDQVSSRDVEAGQIKTGSIQKRLTLTFKDVTVRVTASGVMLGETLLSRIDPRAILTNHDGEQRVSQVEWASNEK